MRKPVLRPSPAVQLGSLNVNGVVAGIEVDIADSGHLSGNWVSDAHFLEVGRGDQVNILAWNWPYTHHAQHHEGTHRSAVVIPCDTGGCSVELRGDVKMAVLGGESRSAGVVELEHGQKCLLVAHVEQSGLVEEYQAAGKLFWPSELFDQ